MFASELEGKTQRKCSVNVKYPHTYGRGLDIVLLGALNWPDDVIQPSHH